MKLKKKHISKLQEQSDIRVTGTGWGCEASGPWLLWVYYHSYYDDEN